MLKPSGGLFKKLFSPGRMASMRKQAAPSAPAKKSGGFGAAGRAVSRMKPAGSVGNTKPNKPFGSAKPSRFSRGGSMGNRRGGVGFGSSMSRKAF